MTAKVNGYEKILTDISEAVTPLEKRNDKIKYTDYDGLVDQIKAIMSERTILKALNEGRKAERNERPENVVFNTSGGEGIVQHAQFSLSPQPQQTSESANEDELQNKNKVRPSLHSIFRDHLKQQISLVLAAKNVFHNIGNRRHSATTLQQTSQHSPFQSLLSPPIKQDAISPKVPPLQLPVGQQNHDDYPSISTQQSPELDLNILTDIEKMLDNLKV